MYFILNFTTILYYSVCNFTGAVEACIFMQH